MLYTEQIAVDGGTELTPAYAAAFSSSQAVTVFDFTAPNELLVRFRVDSDEGSAVDLQFDADFVDMDGLLAQLNGGSPTGMCTWTEEDGILICTSNTTGLSSKLEWAFEPATGTGTIYIEDQVVTGGVSTYSGQTLLYTATSGTANSPQNVLVALEDSPSSDLAIGGSDVAFDSAPGISGVATLTVPMVAGEKLYAIAEPAGSVNVNILVTRH